MLKLVPDFLTNSNRILNIVHTHEQLFRKREQELTHVSVFPFSSKFKTLMFEDMSDALLSEIFESHRWSDHTRNFHSFIQIQKYEPGDFIVPHRDDYEITELNLVTLTSSEHDGLIVDDGTKNLVKIYDLAGQKIEFDANAWHWVDPVKDLRYSLVVGV